MQGHPGGHLVQLNHHSQRFS